MDPGTSNVTEIKVMKSSRREGSLSRYNKQQLREEIMKKDSEIMKIDDKTFDFESETKRKERKMQKKINTLKCDREELQQERDADINDARKYKMKAKQHEKTIEELTLKKEAFNKEITVIEKRNEELKRLLESERLKHEEMSKGKEAMEVVNKMRITVLSLESEKDRLNNQLLKVQSEKQISLEKLRLSIDDLIEEKHTLELRISSMDAALQESNEKESEERDKTEQLNLLLKNQQSTIEDHESKILSLTKELLELRLINTRASKGEQSGNIHNIAVPLLQINFAVTSSSTENNVPVTSQVFNTKSVDLETSMCPNCGNYFVVNEVEEHLITCLDEY